LINFLNSLASSGTFAFTKAQTQGPDPQAATATAGDALAAFLLGAGNSGSIPIVAGASLKDWYNAGYFQDDIRLTNELTVNLGLRYETESPVTDRHNLLNYFDPNVASPAANVQFPTLTGDWSLPARMASHPMSISGTRTNSRLV
jgi:outer membrane receptor protein involved in Fe transport